jgi:hypothetical protein
MKLCIYGYGEFEVFSVNYGTDERGPIDICIIATKEVIEELNANNLLGNYHLDSLVDPRTNILYSESLSARLPEFKIKNEERVYFISNIDIQPVPNYK